MLALTVQTGYTVTNDQRTETISGQMKITGTGQYPAGGFALDSVILAIPECTGTIMRVIVQSDVASGYIWQRVPSTGKLEGLQVPPTGSLTTASPLQQLPSTVDNITLQNETLNFVATIKRNS
jgi:hypothetical protein